MNKELLLILKTLRKADEGILIRFCLKMNCIGIECDCCPVRNKYKCSGEHFITQMTLTMEAVNHETRNPTSD